MTYLLRTCVTVQHSEATRRRVNILVGVTGKGVNILVGVTACGLA